MAKIVIFGAGETGRLAYEYFTHDSEHEVAAFAVDAAYRSTDEFLGLPLVTTENALKDYPPEKYLAFVAVASNKLNYDRKELYLRVKGMGYGFTNYISSRAFIWRDVKIGENCFILENNVIQSGVNIGDNVTLWSGNHIGHMTAIQSHCFISSHVVISGFCNIGENTFMGVNSCVADKVTIERDNFIGMAAVVNKNTEADFLYTGNPAEKKIPAKKFCKV